VLQFFYRAATSEATKNEEMAASVV